MNHLPFFRNQPKYTNNLNLNELLTKNAIPLDKVLQQDAFLVEFKNSNPKVISYMKYDKLQTLTSYLTQVGDPQDQKRSFKFPYVACEVLCCDVPLVFDMFLPSEPLVLEEKVIEDVEEDQNDQMLKEVVQNFQTKSGEKSQKEKIIQKNAESLIYSLFRYFEGEVNYTLAGYVCKVMLSFIAKKPAEMHTFLLQPQRANLLFKHIESRSVCELVAKILTYQTKQSLAERGQLMKQLIRMIPEQTETHIISNICSCICDVIDKISANAKGQNYLPELMESLLSQEIIKLIMTNIISQDLNVSGYCCSVFVYYLLNCPSHQEFFNEEEFVEEFWSQSLMKMTQMNTLGTMKMVEILNYMLKEDLMLSRDIIVKKQMLWPNIIRIFRKYPMNNILHNDIVKLFDICFVIECDELLWGLVNEDLLLKFMVEEIQQDRTIKRNVQRKGYIGHIIKICTKIEQSSNEILNQIRQRSQFQKVMEQTADTRDSLAKDLGGHCRLRNQKHCILFEKEDIIKKNQEFLNNTPPPIFKAQNQPQEVSCFNLAQEASTEEPIRYWSQYLSYDSVDELMLDL